MIWRAIFGSLLLLGLGQAQASDDKVLCETKTATIPVPEYQHCQKGDLVRLETHEVARRCDLSKPVVMLDDDVLCTYRGEKRPVRERPLTDVEKAYDKEQVDSLVEEYAD